MNQSLTRLPYALRFGTFWKQRTMLREIGGLSVIGLCGWLVVGGSADYSRVVDRPPHEVAEAIADLDIRQAPGSPGTDPIASGGELPTFKVETAPDEVRYVVLAGGEVAVRMIAHLAPIDGGARTMVTASVERGPARDDIVSPAFRSPGLTLGLFATLLEDEIDKLVFHVGPWGPHCDAVMARFEARNMANEGMHQPTGLTDAVAGTAKAVMSISMLDKELKLAGCPQSANANAPRDADGFTEVRDTMSAGTAPVHRRNEERPVPSPEAATKPTTDLGKYR